MAPLQILAATPPLLVVAFGLGLIRASKAMRDLYPAPLPAVQEQADPPHDPRLLTAAVLLDHRGTEVSDFLLPYELLAASGAFNVYAAAADPRPAVLTGGLDVVPDASYAQLDRLPTGRADLVVVPHMPTPAPAVISWIRDQANAGATVLSICTGAGVVAAAGVFDGRSATAHWADLAKFERRYPQVEWVRGVRFVDGGDVPASAGITSGIDATLHIIRRLAGGDAMQRAADAIGYSDLRYLQDPAAEQYRPAPADAVVLLSAAFNRRPDIGVLLRDGVDETALAAAPDSGPPYAAIGQALDDLARHAGRPIARFAAKRLEHRSTSNTS